MLRHASGGPAIRDCLAAIAVRNPFVPGDGQEIHEAPVVNAQYRLEAEAVRRDHLAEACALDAIEHELRALWTFKGRHEFAAMQFGAHVAQSM